MRARMRGLAGIAVGAATVLAGVPQAAAGTYVVASCGAPGAGGVNKAWRPEATGFPPNVPPEPGSYQMIDQCPGQLVVQSNPDASVKAPFLTGGNWSFDAPAGNRVIQFETWRYGRKSRTEASDPDSGSPGDQGDPWKIFARDEGASIIGGGFGESCQIVAPATSCSFGADAGMGAASRAVYPINVARISYAVSCEEFYGGCKRTAFDGPYAAVIKVFGTRITISDGSAPGLRVGGALLAAGWRRPSDRLTYDATDSAGVRAVRLELAGRAWRDTASCDYRVPAPCAARRQGTLSVPSDTPDGELAARIIAEDAAGNPVVLQRTIKLDGTAPTAVLERARGRSIVISLTDSASGVAGATLEVRKNSTEPYRTLDAKVANGRLTAKLDRGRASRIDMRVTVRDAAGNVTRGNPTRLSATSAKVGRRFRKVRSGRVKVPFGRRATLRGRLTLSAGQSFAGQTVVATATVRRHGAHAQPAGSAVTDRRGRFSLPVPPGPSRTYRLVFSGAGGALGAARGVSVRVPASSTIHTSRTRLSGAGRVRFTGRLRSRGQRVPGRGLVLILQGRERGRWRTFADTRTNAKGGWHVSYSFSGRPGRYPIRVRIRRQSTYPFELGYSRALSVRVG
ncbi:MAG: carboxypeptidase-like regulatory domain-containing protein [Solirubrobacteraceae bacterium]